ncbi:MAG: ABC transporter ATP-binding protein [Micropruina sp.]
MVEDVSLDLTGRHILDQLSFTAEVGQVTALLGPNGAGKTTTIRCCTGLLAPDSGRIEVLGQAPGSAKASSQIGFMPQSTGAWSGIRAGELLGYLGGLYARPHSPAALIDALGIRDFADLPYRRLSGGQQQLVNLAGALVGRPRLVFLDEPTAGLDPHVRRATWAVIRSLRDAGAAILLTTHDMDEAAALADQVWIMDQGRIAVSGTVPELTATNSLEEVFLSHTHRTDA